MFKVDTGIVLNTRLSAEDNVVSAANKACTRCFLGTFRFVGLYKKVLYTTV